MGFEDIKYDFIRGLCYVLIFGIPLGGIVFSVRSCIVKKQNTIVYIDKDEPHLFHTDKRCKMLDGKDVGRIKYKNAKSRYYCPICKEEDEEFAAEEAEERWKNQYGR